MYKYMNESHTSLLIRGALLVKYAGKKGEAWHKGQLQCMDF
jgi:hypothetical protein